MAIEPTPEQVAEVSQVLDDNAEQVKQAIDEGKKNHSLSDYLKNIRRRTETVTIFLDLEAVKDYEKKNQNAEILAGHAESVEDQDMKVEILERYNQAEETAEQAKVAMLSHALAFRMQALPRIATKVAARKARDIYALEDGVVPETSEEYMMDKYLIFVLKDALLEIRASDGTSLDITVEGLEELRDQIEPSQWDRLKNGMSNLVFVDGLVQLATEDPGF